MGPCCGCRDARLGRNSAHRDGVCGGTGIALQIAKPVRSQFSVARRSHLRRVAFQWIRCRSRVLGFVSVLMTDVMISRLQ